MARTNPPAKVASNAPLGLGSEVHHLPTPEELRSYADDADQHCDRWVPLSPASLRAMADEFDRQAAELDRRFGIGGELIVARRDRDEVRDKLTVKNLALMHAISTLELDGDEWAVCDSLRAAYKA